MHCGLLGGKLGHSYSPAIHSYLGDYSYSLFEKTPDELEDFLKNGDFIGLNVTIPYKKAVIPYCTELSPCAQKLGAVNTIVKRADGTLIGHNTDYFGFQSMLNRSGLSVAGKKVLVLGSGGASATAVAVLTEAGANVVVISRNGENSYDHLHKHSDAAVIVNATPVGMYPHNGDAPLSITGFPALEGVLDLIYNPARTALLLEAEDRGLVTENGLWMLVSQAAESAGWFMGNEISMDVVPTIHKTLKDQMENIVLIGMPGCGKSTIGKLLAEKLNRPFIDADPEIEKAAGMPIPRIFAEQGEAGFRAIESRVLAKLGAMSGVVIATGGGCVTRPENYNSLHQNGTIYYLTRDIQVLPTDGRPLSMTNSIQEMFRVRKPLYEQFSDHEIDNNSSAEDAVNAIMEMRGAK